MQKCNTIRLGAALNAKAPKQKKLSSIDDVDGIVSGEFLQDFFDISHETVRRLGRDGTFVKVGRARYDFIASVRGYCGSLRETAAGRGGSNTADGELARARAGLAEEQRLTAQVKRLALQGQYLPAHEVEREWASICRSIRARLLSLPGRIRAQLPHMTQADVEIIDRTTRDQLDELAADELEAAGGDPQPRARKPTATAEAAS